MFFKYFFKEKCMLSDVLSFSLTMTMPSPFIILALLLLAVFVAGLAFYFAPKNAEGNVGPSVWIGIAVLAVLVFSVGTVVAVKRAKAHVALVVAGANGRHLGNMYSI